MLLWVLLWEVGLLLWVQAVSSSKQAQPFQRRLPTSLLVQAANLWGQGVDKLPLWGRYKWVEDNLAQVVGECNPLQTLKLTCCDPIRFMLKEGDVAQACTLLQLHTAARHCCNCSHLCHPPPHSLLACLQRMQRTPSACRCTWPARRGR